MSPFHHRAGRVAALLTGSAFALATIALPAGGAAAGGRDRDGDGMPNRWESRHGLNPDRANARADKDHDGLVNLAEFRHDVDPADEDSDNDGADDGDEVHDGSRSTRVGDRDSDDDGVVDGDEDSDHDSVENEDEDDADESCLSDDDDVDDDHVSDEDENDFRGLRRHDSDSDDDGVLDGDEVNRHGEAHEDGDDSLDDDCSDDSEDVGDLLGTITTAYDASTQQFAVTPEAGGDPLTFTLTEDTKVEFDSSGHGSGGDASVDDLTEGADVAEVDLDDDGTLEEIELVRTTD